MMEAETPRAVAPTVRQVGRTFVIDLGDGLNQINPAYVERLGECIRVVARCSDPCGLVTTASGRYWSMGLDLTWVNQNLREASGLVTSFQSVLADVLTLGAHTVAALDGPAVGAGAVLVVAHDTVVMSNRRASWSLPEVNLDLVLPPGFVEVIAARTPLRVAHEAVTTGRRYRGTEAINAGLVDHVVNPAEVLATAMGLADRNATRTPSVLAGVKSALHGVTVASLLDGDVGAQPPLPPRALEAMSALGP